MLKDTNAVANEAVSVMNELEKAKRFDGDKTT